MAAKNDVKKELDRLVAKAPELIRCLGNKEKDWDSFRSNYQDWYSASLRIVEVLAPDRYQEFRSYYEIDSKRGEPGIRNYVIQDYMKGLGLSDILFPGFDADQRTKTNIRCQLAILQSLASRIDTVLAGVEGTLLADLHDDELKICRDLVQVSPRAAGALAGIVLESYLQRAAKNHGITSRKKRPTIADFNDPLKTAGIYDTAIWRKVSYLADIRNKCAHKKEREPKEEEVIELIDGVNWFIKTVL